MISFLIGLLSIGLWALCLMLILLILVQLPKKEAGAGLAFGAGAAEAVFGAGAGTPLSKFTRLCATSFLAVALLLYVFNAMEAGKGDRLLEQEASAQVIGTMPATGSETTAAPAAEVAEPALPADSQAPVAPTAVEVNEESSSSAEAEGNGGASLSEAPAEGEAQPLTVEPATPATEPNPNN